MGGDLVFVIEQIPVHRLLGEGEIGQHQAVADLPAIPAGDRRPYRVQQLGQRYILEIVHAGQLDALP